MRPTLFQTQRSKSDADGAFFRMSAVGVDVCRKSDVRFVCQVRGRGDMQGTVAIMHIGSVSCAVLRGFCGDGHGTASARAQRQESMGGMIR